MNHNKQIFPENSPIPQPLTLGFMPIKVYCTVNTKVCWCNGPANILCYSKTQVCLHVCVHTHTKLLLHPELPTAPTVHLSLPSLTHILSIISHSASEAFFFFCSLGPLLNFLLILLIPVSVAKDISSFPMTPMRKIRT